MNNTERLEKLAWREREDALECGDRAHVAMTSCFGFLSDIDQSDIAAKNARDAFHHAGNVLALEHASMLVYSHD